MEIREIESGIEGILFAAGEPVPAERLAMALEVDLPTLESVLKQMEDYYRFERRGIRLIRLEDSWQLCSAPELGEKIRKALETRKPPQLSPSALETLSIVAYYQPVTRAYVDQVRGVDSSYTMGLLQERSLIEECGRLQVPGRPILYRTTQNFLRTFGVASLEELPELPAEDEDGQLSMLQDLARQQVPGQESIPEEQTEG